VALITPIQQSLEHYEKLQREAPSKDTSSGASGASSEASEASRGNSEARESGAIDSGLSSDGNVYNVL